MFLNAFAELESGWNLCDEEAAMLEYVCALYGTWKNSVDAKRFETFI